MQQVLRNTVYAPAPPQRRVYVSIHKQKQDDTALDGKVQTTSGSAFKSPPNVAKIHTEGIIQYRENKNKAGERPDWVSETKDSEFKSSQYTSSFVSIPIQNLSIKHRMKKPIVNDKGDYDIVSGKSTARTVSNKGSHKKVSWIKKELSNNERDVHFVRFY